MDGWQSKWIRGNQKQKELEPICWRVFVFQLKSIKTQFNLESNQHFLPFHKRSFGKGINEI